MFENNGLLVLGSVLIAVALYIYKRDKNGGSSRKTAHGSILTQFTTDLTEEARAKKLDPVIGRQDEIDRVIHILSRRRKNNPLLIGEPGVGKTAVIEGLAIRIVEGAVPASLAGKRILALDLPGMISGTKYRGEFEERMRKLTREIQSTARSIILFVDEVHMLEQASGTEGGMNVSDILKPALARGDLQAVGATTWREYEKFIRPDDALDRRFQPVLIGEPKPEDALAILRGTKAVYEAYHHVTIDDDALKEAVTGSKAIENRFLPDKAIDLIDEACAKVAIESVSSSQTTALGVVHSACKGATGPCVTVKDIQQIILDWIKKV